jgi:hypothetical protein
VSFDQAQNVQRNQPSHKKHHHALPSLLGQKTQAGRKFELLEYDSSDIYTTDLEYLIRLYYL